MFLKNPAFQLKKFISFSEKLGLSDFGDFRLPYAVTLESHPVINRIAEIHL